MTAALQFGLRRLLRLSNIRRCSAATCAAILAVTPAAAILAEGAAEANAPAAASAETPIDDSLPDAAGVVEAYMKARGWVDRFYAPPFDHPDSRIEIGNASGVCVILRSAGRVVGTGVAAEAPASERELMLRRAVGRALAEVLGDAAVATLPEDQRGAIGEKLTLEMEVAGPLQPLLGRVFHQVAQQIEPGLDGVAMRRGDARAMLFPSQIRALPAGQGDPGNLYARLPGLATDLGLAASDLATLQHRHNVSLHRFRTTHLAQQAPSRLPFETHRGDQLVGLYKVTPQAIARFADGVASHLMAKIWSHEPSDDRRLALGLMGDYALSSDTYRPIVALPLDQALAALALMSYAGTDGVDVAMSEQARRAAATILSDLEQVEEGESDPLDDPAACAVIVLILTNHPELADEAEKIGRLKRGALRVVYGSFDAEEGFAIGSDGLPPAPHVQAMLTAAIAQRLTLPDAALKPVDIEYARTAIGATWASVPSPQHVTLLPWIGWAEVAYAEAAREPVAGGERLREIRRALYEARSIAGAEMALDLQGGFPLAVGADAGRADAQTSRPAAFFATMLRQPELTPPGELAMHIEQHRETMRFLMQLGVRESLAWSLRNPRAALGGVRASAWDSRMPTAAQALSLLAACESLRSLSGVSSAEQPQTRVRDNGWKTAIPTHPAVRKGE